MTFTDRVLPPEEWSRLAGTELELVVPHLTPDMATIAVVEDEAGAIVGCWAVLRIWHAEGVWIAEAHRGHTSVARRLWKRMARMCQALGVERVITGADRPEIASLLAGRAIPLPAQEYVLCLPSSRS